LTTDKRSVGSITSQLQDDAARLQAFSGEPIRSMLTAMSAVIIGVTLSFIVRISLLFLLFLP
jgi:ATP-binding cassette, subfamily B (MDR/TAP), member 1